MLSNTKINKAGPRPPKEGWSGHGDGGGKDTISVKTDQLEATPLKDRQDFLKLKVILLELRLDSLMRDYLYY